MKIYEITFNQYTNAMHDCVSKGKETGSADNYLSVPKTMLIEEKDIEKIREYGEGIRELKYVGDLVCLKDVEKNKKDDIQCYCKSCNKPIHEKIAFIYSGVCTDCF